MSALACGCGRIDVHAHFLPDFYCEALAKAGLTTVDGGMPIPAWSADAALEVMDRQEIATAMVSLSSPSTHFLPQAERGALCRQANEAGAELVRAHPGRFGYFASLPMPDVEAALAEIAFAFERRCRPWPRGSPPSPTCRSSTRDQSEPKAHSYESSISVNKRLLGSATLEHIHAVALAQAAENYKRAISGNRARPKVVAIVGALVGAALFAGSLLVLKLA